MVGFTHAATRPSHTTECLVQAWFRLQSGVAVLYSVKLVDELLDNRLRILHIPAP